jgi:ubiquinone/menaquinone biosynthesis C-methylase UbiE
LTTTEIIKKRYNRTSLFYDCMDKMVNQETRKKVMGYARGKVLEVGVGTGQNLKYYPRGCDVTAIDFSPGMIKKARMRAEGLPNVKLYEMDVQNLAFPDNTFDTILATCVFCSVPDPVKGFAELQRVCKPNGQLIFLEHIRSDRQILGMLMDLFNPLVVRLIGANINRRTLENIETAGLKLEQVDTVGMEVIKLIIAKPNKA